MKQQHIKQQISWIVRMPTFWVVHDCENVFHTCDRKSYVQLSGPKHVSAVNVYLCTFCHTKYRHLAGCCEHDIYAHVPQELVHPGNILHTACNGAADSVHVFQRVLGAHSDPQMYVHTLDKQDPIHCYLVQF